MAGYTLERTSQGCYSVIRPVAPWPQVMYSLDAAIDGIFDDTPISNKPVTVSVKATTLPNCDTRMMQERGFSYRDGIFVAMFLPKP